MENPWLGGAFTAVLGAVLGFLAKVLYDRRFAKRPDLRYAFHAPAKFGTGDRERVYQNLEISNIGTQAATDVCIIFRRPSFDLAEHQVIYEGQYNLEKTEDRAIISIASLPPQDSATISFLIDLSKSEGNDSQHLFVSARSREYLGTPSPRVEIHLQGGLGPVYMLITALAILAAFLSTGTQYWFAVRPGMVETKKPKIATLTIQVPDLAVAGKEVEADLYVENMADNRFVGSLRVSTPWWGGDQPEFKESINIAAKARERFKWKLKVPKNVQPGKYTFSGELFGKALNEVTEVWATGTVEVK